jgi:hypothetical protein
MNDLQAMPTTPVFPMESEEAICAANATCTIRRWTGSEVMNRSLFEVPAIVGAYSSFMNAVDGMDQIQSSCPTRHHEKRVPMMLFMLVLDLVIKNKCMSNTSKTKRWNRINTCELCDQLVWHL